MERFCICFYYGQAGYRLRVAFALGTPRAIILKKTQFSYSPAARCSSSSPLEIEQNHLYIHFGIAIMVRKAGDDSNKFKEERKIYFNSHRRLHTSMTAVKTSQAGEFHFSEKDNKPRFYSFFFFHCNK